ncbi:MAG: putative capsid protein [Virus sp.]|nr:MAG: putative capsid protein [Virus sp.]
MYAKRFGKRKAVRARRPYKRVPRKRSGGRQAITKIVKSVLSRQAENKAWFDYGANQSITCVASGPFISKNLIPVLSQGVGKSQRVGNEVRVKSGFVRGHVNILPFENTTNNLPVPCYVKMWVCSYKTLNSNGVSGTNQGTAFFDIVNGSIGPQGNMLDIDFTVNKDSWVLHGTKTVKLGSAYPSATGPVGSSGYYDNSPMSAPFSFNFGKYIKTLKYDDATTVATNRNMFLSFQVVPANGATGSGQIMAEFHYTTRVEYEDA